VSSGQGTFTTAGATAQAFTTETITAITGTYTRSGTSGDGTYQITGLDNSVFNGGQRFQWDGTNTSQIISDIDGIEFLTDAGANVIILNGNAGMIFSSVDSTATGFSGFDGSISSSSLSPVPASSSAPSPLPLFGAAAAFGWSRQLRRRIKTSV